jgi:large subunit ribosomal protein L4
MQSLSSTFRGMALKADSRARAPQKNNVQTRRAIVTKASVVAEPASLDVKSVDGKSAGTAALSLKVASPETANGLVHRYVVMVRQNMRQVRILLIALPRASSVALRRVEVFSSRLSPCDPSRRRFRDCRRLPSIAVARASHILFAYTHVQGNASTLTRGEVRGGGAKPYKQKGTGNARIGTKRTPLRPGGGISFGPKPRDWSITMNKKEKRLALATAIQSAAEDMIVVEDFAQDMSEIKTKGLVAKLEAVGANPTEEKTLLIVSEPSENVYMSGRNVEFLAINVANAVQVYDVLGASKVVIEKSALEYINEYYGSD